MKFMVYLYDQTRDWAQPHEHPLVVNFEDKMIENIRKIDKAGKKRKLSKGDQVRFRKEYEKYLKELFKDKKLWETKELSLSQMAKKLGENYWASSAITFEVRLIEITTELREYVTGMRFIIFANPAQIQLELRN